MWQTIVTLVLLAGAAVFLVRHYLRVYRTGNDSGCTGCSCSGACGAKLDADSTRSSRSEEQNRQDPG